MSNLAVGIAEGYFLIIGVMMAAVIVATVIYGLFATLTGR